MKMNLCAIVPFLLLMFDTSRSSGVDSEEIPDKVEISYLEGLHLVAEIGDHRGMARLELMIGKNRVEIPEVFLKGIQEPDLLSIVVRKQSAADNDRALRTIVVEFGEPVKLDLTNQTVLAKQTAMFVINGDHLVARHRAAPKAENGKLVWDSFVRLNRAGDEEEWNDSEEGLVNPFTSVGRILTWPQTDRPAPASDKGSPGSEVEPPNRR